MLALLPVVALLVVALALLPVVALVALTPVAASVAQQPVVALVALTPAAIPAPVLEMFPVSLESPLRSSHSPKLQELRQFWTPAVLPLVLLLALAPVAVAELVILELCPPLRGFQLGSSGFLMQPLALTSALPLVGPRKQVVTPSQTLALEMVPVVVGLETMLGGSSKQRAKP